MSIYMSNSSNMVIKLRMHLTHFYMLYILISLISCLQKHYQFNEAVFSEIFCENVIFS